MIALARDEQIVRALANPWAALRERELIDAVWAGDVDRLHELVPCNCCCEEHTSDSCPARQWYGCRGQNTHTGVAVELSWLRHYQQFHGMTEDQFCGVEAP